MNARLCPNWRLGRLTCADARRRYFTDYHARRLASSGTPIQHGTSSGYLSGCRSVEMCPRDQSGRSCHEARAEYWRQRARAAGIQPSPPTVAAGDATRLLTELAQLPLTGRAIARITGLGRSTIARLLSASTDNTLGELLIREHTLDAIAAAHAAHVLELQRG